MHTIHLTLDELIEFLLLGCEPQLGDHAGEGVAYILARAAMTGVPLV